jgi:hypothetical protein
MRWRRNWSARPPRPKVRRLSADEQKKLLPQMASEVARSPVLSGFGIQVRFLRGRFYIERSTPLATEMCPKRDCVQITLARRFTEAEIKELLRVG